MRIPSLRSLTQLVTAFVVVVFVIPASAAGVLLATNLFVPLPAVIPDPEEIEAIRFSHVYDINGNLIHTFQQFDQSIPVQMGDIPEHVKNAVIAAEDRSFYSHGGFDIRGTIRALVTDVREGELSQGGSTITQQLAKNAYGVGRERTFTRKIREAVLAAQLDRSLSKEQILFKYLSIVYFGEGAYGIGAAAQVYFDKPVNNLTLSEAAMLAGVIPAPSRFNPRVDPGTAEIRRRQVIDIMLEEELITFDEWNAAKDETVWLESNGEPPGPATLVRSRRTEAAQYPYFIQYLARELTEHFGNEDILYRGGLEIHTTLDPRAQAEAEATVAETLEGIDPVTDDEGGSHVMQMAITAVEPPTGFIRAMVGGRDFSTNQTNIAVKGSGSIGRQPGSAFKPVVLATAFEQGIKPSAVYSGGPYKKGDYEPENYGGARYGNLTLRTATQKSVNTVFVRLMEDVGPYEVVDLANELGLQIPDIDPARDGLGLSIALGSREVSPLGMASAYGTFANGGLRQEPTPIVRVFGPDGELLIDNAVRQEDPLASGTQVLRDATADNVTNVLEGVLTSGTAAGKGIGRPAAGKTGTTQDSKDGWFVGYTPTLSTAVFMGWDPPPAPGVTYRVKGRNLTGGSFPASAWQRFMKAALEGVPITDFDEPAPIRSIASEDIQRERRGYAPGPSMPRQPSDPGGPYLLYPETPAPEQPTTTTTTTTEPPSTTTTRPGILFPPGEN